MNFGALIIGDEILSGRREDKHLARTIAALESRGLALAWARYIGDEPERIVAEIRAAAASGCSTSSTPSARAAHWRVWSSGVAPMPPNENTVSPDAAAARISATMRSGSSPM